MNVKSNTEKQLHRVVCITLLAIMTLCSVSTVFIAKAEEDDYYSAAGENISLTTDVSASDVSSSDAASNSDLATEALETEDLLPSIDYQTEQRISMPLVTASEGPLVTAGSLPSAYSSYNMGYMSKVKYQGGAEDTTCWIYSSIAAMECAINKNYPSSQKVVLSEEQVKVSTLTHLGNGTEVNPIGKRREYSTVGGNFDIFVNYAVNGACLVEAGGKYPEVAHIGPDDCTTGYFKAGGDPLPTLGESLLQPDYNLMKTDWILDNTTVASGITTAAQRADLRNRIKEAVYEYGAVYTSIASKTLNSEHPFLCVKDSSKYQCDHAVVIVGWDDNIDKSFFYPNTPSMNGAFLCKNSWGEGYRADRFKNFTAGIEWPLGYFWLSYDDVYCGSTSAVICDVEEAKPNQVTYFHYLDDSNVKTIYPGAKPKDYWTEEAVKYETKYASERLESVSFFSPNVGLKFQMYLVTADKYMEDSTAYLNTAPAKLIASGTTDNCGLYTVKMIDDFIIEDKTFYIIFRATNYVAMPCEEDDSAEDISFVYDNGWKESDSHTYFYVRTTNTASADSIPVRLVNGKTPTVDVTATFAGGAQSVHSVPAQNGNFTCTTGLSSGQTANIHVGKKGYLGKTVYNYRSGATYVPEAIELYAGDANNDGIINIFDVTTLINYNTRKVDESDTANYELYGHCDYNNDGFVNIFDITTAIDSLNRIYN